MSRSLEPSVQGQIGHSNPDDVWSGGKWHIVYIMASSSSLFPLKYVLIRFIAENDCSLVALVAGRTRSSFASLVTSGNNIFWLLFFPEFTNGSNNFVTDILLVSKNAAN